MTKPNEPKRNPKVPAPPRKPATTWVPFSIRDSNALERAYALTQPIREEKTQQPGQDGKRISEDLPPLTQQQHQHNRQDPPSRLQVPDASGQFQTSSIAVTTTGAGGESILVNEDYLFEVNIHKMEIKPVRRASFFFFFFFFRNTIALTSKGKKASMRQTNRTEKTDNCSRSLFCNIGLLGWPYV